MSKKSTIQINQEFFSRNPNRFTVDVSGIKTRKTWKISPVERIHEKRENRKQAKQNIRRFLRGDFD